MRAMNVAPFLCAITWWLVSLTPSAEASWSTTLQEAEALRKLGNWQDALNKFDEACDSAAQSQPRIGVKDMERVTWERAEAYDAFAHEELGPDTKRKCAKKAASFWKEYVDWYTSLSNAESLLLGDPRAVGSQHRICKAAVLMGQELVDAGQVEMLFDEYEIMPMQYLNPDAVELWKTWLYADRLFGQTPRGERTSEMRSEAIKIRPERWRAYGNYLTTWVETFYLTTVTRDKYRREAVQVISATADV